MSQITLEVGKTYEVRDPKKCMLKKGYSTKKIVKEKSHASLFPFVSEDLDDYMEDGRFFITGDSIYDLVREVTPDHSNQKQSKQE